MGPEIDSVALFACARKRGDKAAKAAFVQRYEQCGVEDGDLTRVTVVDPFFKAF
jgi:hypothetical protein